MDHKRILKCIWQKYIFKVKDNEAKQVIRAIRWKFLWGILQSSSALLQTSVHVSRSTVGGPAVVVLLINIIGD